MYNFVFHMPAKVLFGPGKLQTLHEETLPGKKALIVTTNGTSVKKYGYLAALEKELDLAGVGHELFDQIRPNPTSDNVMDGAALGKKTGCDFVVALGGGSVMDCGKCIALMMTNPGTIWDYSLSVNGGKKAAPVAAVPIVAITTSAGTGSEVDMASVITNEATKEKTGIFFPSMMPTLSIVDANLMKSVPPKFTAYQGFDALFHSVEGYLSVVSSPMSEMVQLAAIENIGTYLPRAVKDGSDLEAREHVAFANTMSGYSMVVGSCTSEHSMEHAMSAFHPALPHGAGLIMISVEYYRHFIEKHCCDERFVRMAQALGMKDAKAPEDFITALKKLQEDCGVSDLKMSDYGIEKEESMVLARNAKATMGGLFACDPVPMTDEECTAIYEKSYR